MERRALVITGPTCTGKTELAIKIANRTGGEIISADSRQLYRFLDIGTAKPSREELRKAKHHFIDHLNPDEDYNVSRFENESSEVLNKLFLEGRLPIIAGGSGLYVKAVTEGIFDEADTDNEYREYLHKIRTNQGNEGLYELLKAIDPAAAEKMLPQNWKRVMRALEVFKLTGKSILWFHEKHKPEKEINFVKIGLTIERELLYKLIENRVDKMIDTGLINEVESILSSGWKKELNSLNTVGYKEIISFLEGEISRERAVELIKRNTRRFAKRQMTWFRRDEKIIWKEVDQKTDFDKLAEEIISEYF